MKKIFRYFVIAFPLLSATLLAHAEESFLKELVGLIGKFGKGVDEAVSEEGIG